MENSRRPRTRRIASLSLFVLVLVPQLASSSATATVTALTEPTTPILDDFDGRGLEDPLYQWGNWSPSSIDGSGQTLEIAGGGASHNDGDGVEADSYRIADASGDVEAYATVRSSAEHNSDMFLYINLQQTGTSGWDGYRARWFHWISVDQFHLEKVVDGVATAMASPVHVDPAIGDVLLLRNSGGTIELWHKSAGAWFLRLGAGDGSFSGGKIGLGMNDDGGVWDDFGGSGTTTPPPPTPPVPATDVVDHFDRANEDPLSQSGAWSDTPLYGSGQTLEVLDGTAGQNEASTIQANSFRTAEVVGDAEVHARIAAGPENNQYFHLYLHLQEAGTAGVDGYAATWFHWIATDGLYVQKLTDGVATTLAGPLALDLAVGDVLLLRRIGLTVDLWRKSGGQWTKLLSAVDGSYTSGRLGLGLDDDRGKWDDFGGGALSAPPSPPPPPPPPPTSGPPPEQSHGICGGIGTHAHSASRCLSDPVNTLTGAFVTSTEDIAFSNVGVPFSWTRTYPSSDSMAGRLGAGWTHSYAASLDIEPTGDVRLRGEEGQIVEYARQQDGSFTGAPGARSRLSSVADGYQLVRTDQVVYRFGAQGRLLSIEDRNGQGLTLEYDAAGRLTTIAGASQQAHVSYNEAGLVSAISHAGRSVAYGYTAGRLTSVTDLRGKLWRYTYDPDGRLTTMVDPLGHTQVMNVYGTNGRVVRQTDALGKTTSFAWNATTQTATATDPKGNEWVDDYEDGVLAERSDPLGHTVSIEHDAQLNAAAVTSPGGETTSLRHDARGNLLTATAPASLGGVAKTFVYTATNDPTRITDARGVVTSYAYDAEGNVESVAREGRQVAAYTYDASGQVLTATDGNGQTTTFTYDANGNVASETDPLGNRTTYTHDGAGRMSTRVDPRGNAPGGTPADFTWRWTYDAAGNVLTERNPLGAVTTHAYDDSGNEVTVTDAKGRTTTFAYDAANRLVSETGPDPDGAGALPASVTSYTYDDAGNRRTQTDVLGRTTTFAYDAANRLVSTTGPDPDGAGPLPAPVTTNTYDADGNVAGTVEPRGNLPGSIPAEYRTAFTYDAAGRMLTTTDPLGNVTANSYDAAGNLVSVGDANGHATTSTYDAASRVVSVTAPDGGTTAYTYDGDGNVLTRTDANGNVTRFSYDAAGRLASEIGPDPDGPGPQGPAVTTHTYDANGNLASTVDANGNATATPGDGRTAFEYDASNRLVRIDYADSTSDVTFTYDLVGNRTAMTDSAGTETRTYDVLDRLASVSRGANAFAYSYDAVGNLARRTYPGGRTTVYLHDALDRLTSAAVGNQMTSYSYDAASNLTETTLPAGNGHGESRGYDRAGRLTTVATRRGTAVLAGFVATLDPVGNPTRIVRTGSLQETQRLSYDPNDRITSVCFQAGACSSSQDPFIRWSYDRVGNRLREERGGTGTTTYTYDAADRLTRAGSTSYTYDENGNQLSAGLRTFTYDLANRVRTTRRGSTTTTYTYDGDGLRLRASTGSAASRTTAFLWDVSHAFPQVALERNGSGSTLREYAYGANRISMTSESDTSYFHWDALGSVVNLTSASGAPRWTWSYEPFGLARKEERSGGNAPTNFMRFAGEYLDATELYHLRARDYDPATGRFLRPDPVDQAVGSPLVSSYAYAANRPTVMVDPSGETFRPIDEWQGHIGTATSPEATLEPWPPYVPGRVAGRCPARSGYPLGVIGGFNGGPAAHGRKPPHNWQSDNAIDLNVPVGTKVCAIFAGTISARLGFGRSSEGFRLHLVGRNDIAFYQHLSRIVVKPNQPVERGELLGFSGCGSERVAHLHLALLHGDPMRYAPPFRRPVNYGGC